MMKYYILLSIIVAVASGFAPRESPVSEDFLQKLHQLPKKWQAGRNFHEGIDVGYFYKIMGVLPGSEAFLPPPIQHNLGAEKLPESFDPRDKWTHCPSLNEVRDQGSCGSCWAFGATEVMTDRTCIHSKGKKNFHYSAEDLLTCCSKCGFGCNGGMPGAAFSYWKDHGIVSGGAYSSHQGCQPYQISPCEHHVHGKRPDCNGDDNTPQCIQRCEANYNSTYEHDLHKARKIYSLDASFGIESVMYDLVHNGPIEAAFDVYEDFLNYKSGVYHKVHGSLLGGHAIRLIGYGVEDGTPYWLCVNSWNYDWGDNGFFKILRGQNECGIEQSLVTGIPDDGY